jgi:indolepyruvate ferredoxin oxidoreductase beta subunit
MSRPADMSRASGTPAQELPSALNVVLTGVGGQGSVLATRILAGATRRAGYDVVTSEVHGMAQRGGTVTTTVRLAPRGTGPRSAVIGAGGADCLLAFERLEAARHLALLRPEGMLLVNDQRIMPSVESLRTADYPEDLEERARRRGVTLRLVPALRLAAELNEPKLASVVLLGALARCLGLPADAWRSAIAETAPGKLVQANLAAFEAGRAWMEGAQAASA